MSSEQDHAANPGGDADTVRNHYNKISELSAAPDFKTSLDNRSQSRIVQLRNFNNWMKSCLIQEHIELAKKRFGSSLSALDICCGKGGDLQKWRAGGVKKLVCVDISELSVEQCEQRYNELRDNRKRPAGRNQGGDQQLFNAEFHVADCGRVRLANRYRDPDTQFEIVSCQFSLHYTFETFAQADLMMRNCSESLRRGGYFVCSIPNSNEIVRRCRLALESESKSGSQSVENKDEESEQASSSKSSAAPARSRRGTWRNEVANVSFANPDCLLENNQPPLFGARYSFYLEDVVVDCPEFLIFIPLLKKLASRHGLRMVLCERFDTYFKSKIRDRENFELIDRIRALQPFSLVDKFMRRNLRFDEHSNYDHAVAHLRETGQYAVRTMSKAEWDVVTLYMVVGFEKVTEDRCSARNQPASTCAAGPSGEHTQTHTQTRTEPPAKKEKDVDKTQADEPASKMAKLGS